jgi:ABC-type multidrug transport system ATPase subunit
MTNILEIDSVILEFGVHRVLQDVYLKSETGKVTGLLGRNGAGKSCLMKILFGELIPLDKSIRLNGVSMCDSRRNSADLKYLPQRRYIPGFLTVKRVFEDFDLSFSEFILEFPEFKKLLRSKMKNLSGGERRLVEIYVLLVSKTKFCLLDEPFSQLMPLHVEAIRKIILREKQNKGIVVTDHLYRDIIDICDDLYLISAGKIHLTKSVRDLETLGYVKET